MKPEDRHPALLKRPPRQLVRSPRQARSRGKTLAKLRRGAIVVKRDRPRVMTIHDRRASEIAVMLPSRGRCLGSG
jgi:hypothetical protein